jgi:hypothetical protein
MLQLELGFCVQFVAEMLGSTVAGTGEDAAVVTLWCTCTAAQFAGRAMVCVWNI